MAFCTVDDLHERFGVENITEWSRRDPTQAGGSLVAVSASIETAGELVESSLRGLVELMESETNPLLKKWNCDLAAVELFESRVGLYDEGVSASLQWLEKRVYEQMNAFRNGLMTFDRRIAILPEAED